ncbi:uncharacterized protein LOC124420705 isoform X1 [Lucilia cuprina]|uniref:uncharacterized protein LOC124420705 isoform X1 n=1 Tax=Lucilia cuprina TaxID=7375 RepID=UPI001F054E1E|nr:uncharacterized protein LOC124420705 isoform X1 [Lucilia cuprina]
MDDSSKMNDCDDEEVISISSEENFVIYPDINIFSPQTSQKRNEIKLKRNSGLKYTLAKTQKSVEARIQGPPCGCKRNCRQKLNNAHEDIFNNFWTIGSYDLQNCYLFDCIQVGDKRRCYKTKTKNQQSRRTISASYTVNVNGVNISVCKVEFMNLHGLQNSRGRLDHIIKMKREGAIFPKTDGRGKHTNRCNKKTNEF